MSDRFLSFVLVSRWVSAVVALAYHARFLLFVDYGSAAVKTNLAKAFYFITGLGHESFAVFVVLDGILAGLILGRYRSGIVIERAAIRARLHAHYRIILLALMLGAVLDLTGLRFFNHSGLYFAVPEISTPTVTTSSLLGNMLMLQPFIVPTFGSNTMLYLLSYLFWFFILLVLFIRAARLGQPGRRYARILLAVAVILAMPYEFLIWGAIWLSGVVVVFLGESRLARPRVPVAAACFIAALVCSRLIGANTGGIAQALAGWVVECKFLVVGMTFGVLAWGLYPKSQFRQEGAPSPLNRLDDRQAAQAASFAFFCHFPVVMLFVAMGSALLGRPVMQQPTPVRYAEFALLVGACLGIAVMTVYAASRAIAAFRVRRRARSP
jgi:hypothetical protein